MLKLQEEGRTAGRHSLADFNCRRKGVTAGGDRRFDTILLQRRRLAAPLSNRLDTPVVLTAVPSACQKIVPLAKPATCAAVADLYGGMRRD